MQDRFKFRVWDKFQNEWLYFDFSTYLLYKDRILKAQTNGETFYQCTGLKDKNGKLIYEGDIIKELHDSDYSAVVYYNMKKVAFKLQGKGYYTGALETIRNDYFEVIGNIYKNPELLEAER